MPAVHAWPGCLHVNPDATHFDRGNPWKVLTMEGERNTLWVGSSVSFESTFEVLKDNQRLINRIVVV